MCSFWRCIVAPRGFVVDKIAIVVKGPTPVSPWWIKINQDLPFLFHAHPPFIKRQILFHHACRRYYSFNDRNRVSFVQIAFDAMDPGGYALTSPVQIGRIGLILLPDLGSGIVQKWAPGGGGSCPSPTSTTRQSSIFHRSTPSLCRSCPLISAPPDWDVMPRSSRAPPRHNFAGTRAPWYPKSWSIRLRTRCTSTSHPFGNLNGVFARSSKTWSKRVTRKQSNEQHNIHSSSLFDESELTVNLPSIVSAATGQSGVLFHQ